MSRWFDEWWLQESMRYLHLNEINHFIWTLFSISLTKWNVDENLRMKIFSLTDESDKKWKSCSCWKLDESFLIYFSHCTVNGLVAGSVFCIISSEPRLIKFTGDNFPITLSSRFWNSYASGWRVKLPTASRRLRKTQITFHQNHDLMESLRVEILSEY